MFRDEAWKRFYWRESPLLTERSPQLDLSDLDKLVNYSFVPSFKTDVLLLGLGGREPIDKCHLSSLTFFNFLLPSCHGTTQKY